MRLQETSSRIPLERIEDGLAEVFQRPEFRPVEESWLAQAITDLLTSFDLGQASSSLTWILFVTFSALLTYALVRALRSYDPRRRVAQAGMGAPLGGPSAEERVRELTRRSREARERGELVLALRLAFFALVVGLSRRGDLEYRDAWTNRELAERGRASESLAPELSALVRDLDAKTFGHETVEMADLEHLDELHARWLGDGGAAR